jgi:hypothetical protein
MTILLKLSPTHEAAVFSGDRRLTNADGSGQEDTCTKATPFGAWAVGGACGGTRYVDKATAVEHFNVHRLAVEFFAERRIDTPALDEFAEFLKRQYAVFDREHGGGRPVSRDGRMFSIVATSSEEGAGRIIDHQVRAYLNPDRTLDVRHQSHVCRNGVLIHAGDEEITDALRSLGRVGAYSFGEG